MADVFGALEDYAGWTNNTASLIGIILRSVVTRIANLTRLFNSEVDSPCWPALFHFLRVVENYVFYSPVSIAQGFSSRPKKQIGRAVQQECRDRSRMPSSA
eukprot:TRINITY_DN77497_c0_g1_i1.p1 TRINITY_DN77497_c0_g1~~TRINITY_DN77497_c0_g1_i1.p1  ORF type:complete len:109 (+),score=15.35 TRINITY_DN77497_c0_g1_i1:27-329(+)